MDTSAMFSTALKGARTSAETLKQTGFSAGTNLAELIRKAARFAMQFRKIEPDLFAHRGPSDQERSHLVGYATSFGVGVLVGGAAGLLLAPKEGSETRNDLKKSLDGLLERMAGLKVQVQDKVSEKGAEIKEKATEKGSELLDELRAETGQPEADSQNAHPRSKDGSSGERVSRLALVAALEPELSEANEHEHNGASRKGKERSRDASHSRN